MSGFFALGGNNDSNNQDHHHHNHNHHPQTATQIPPETSSWLFYKNDSLDISYKGMELWQHQHPDLYPSSSIPTRATAITLATTQDPSRSAMVRHAAPPMAALAPVFSSSAAGITCHDCGNQAKKDCVHMRCRTCCKNQGFACPTHVKSTWVPAVKRRERLQHPGFHHHQQRADNFKRHRDHHPSPTSPSLPCPLLPAPHPHPPPPHPPSGEGGNFPAEVNSQALFRCVRVSGVDENEDQYAYQTAVNIGGHIFKGILYYQGPETASHSGGESSSGGGDDQNMNMVLTNPPAVAGGSQGVGAVGSSSDGAFFDGSMYPIPLNSFLAGTHFFPNTRS